MLKPALLLSLLPLVGACLAQESTAGIQVAPASTVRPAAVAGSAEKRAFEITDVYRVATVGSPAFSPDGSRVAFSVKRYDLEKDESWSEIWLVDADGSDPRQMTQGKKSDTSPQFLPGGEEILFVSNRTGSSQLHTIPVAGGEARALTSFPTGVADPVVSPDGRWIAVSAEVFPEAGADAKRTKELLDAAEGSKLEVHVADDLLYRHWTSWKDGRVTHVLLVDAASGEVVRDLTPGPFDAPTFSLGGERGYDFSPDGKELVFVSNHDERQAESTNADLWVVPVEGGEPVNLTDANEGWDGAPLYSPDGRWIAYVSQETPGYESDLRRLALYDRARKSTRYLTSREGFDDWVEDIRFLPEGEILFQADHRGRNPLFRMPLAGGEPVEVLRHGQIDAFDLAPDGASVAYARRRVHEPTELFVAPIVVPSDGGEPVRLTRFNAALEAEVDLRPAEELWIESEGGNAVHVFVVTPHGFDPAKKYPLVLNVHGGPQSQWTDSFRGDWQVYPGKGYVVAFANPTGSNGYGQDFCDAIGKDWGGRVYRDLMKVTDALAELPYVDKERMGAMGWSYGGYMMMWFQGHTDRFRCQAAMMGVYDLRAMHGSTEELWFPEHDLGGAPWESEEYARWSPSNFVENFETPALVITGELDYRVPYTQSLEYFTDLRKRDVPARLVVFPEAGHWPGWREMAFYYNAHLDWFQRWLGGEAAPLDVAEFARGTRRLADALPDAGTAASSGAAGEATAASSGAAGEDGLD
jgi:dipeptidyl aminopeptidase/acylaminoacyl peptidase